MRAYIHYPSHRYLRFPHNAILSYSWAIARELSLLFNIVGMSLCGPAFLNPVISTPTHIYVFGRPHQELIPKWYFANKSTSSFINSTGIIDASLVDPVGQVVPQQ